MDYAFSAADSFSCKKRQWGGGIKCSHFWRNMDYVTRFGGRQADGCQWLSVVQTGSAVDHLQYVAKQLLQTENCLRTNNRTHSKKLPYTGVHHPSIRVSVLFFSDIYFAVYSILCIYIIPLLLYNYLA